MSNELYRLLPSVDAVKQEPSLAEFMTANPPDLATVAVRRTLDKLRKRLDGKDAGGLPRDGQKLDLAFVAGMVQAELAAMMAPSLVPVVNATGVVIHTNLGRSPIGKKTWAAMEAIATSYSNLEYDLDRGCRGTRFSHFESVMKLTTGAEACMVVNNNAAAVLLVLTAMARGKEVVVSRGELIEIGGAFRLPAIMAQGGAILREVGTTNRTHLADFQGAITPLTGLLMKAHRSNFAVTGFTKEVSRAQLAGLAKEHELPFFEDLGSGLMSNLAMAGVDPADQVAQTIKDGVDIVSFSGDKMLGGPQAGIVVGTRVHLDLLKKHPLTRALRPDKITLAGLEATALAYLAGREQEEIPVVRMLSESQDDTRQRADELAGRLDKLDRVTARPVDSLARIGGGSEPETTLPSAGVSVQVADLSETELERRLRLSSPPIICRIEAGSVLLDVRTLLPNDIDTIAAAIESMV